MGVYGMITVKFKVKKGMECAIKILTQDLQEITGKSWKLNRIKLGLKNMDVPQRTNLFGVACNGS
jgi:hypothetical protein